MPAKLVMGKYRRGALHSGSKKGPIVRNKKQAKAILLSEARSEGHDIPKAPRGRGRKKNGRS